jgi:hypothetical protein
MRGTVGPFAGVRLGDVVAYDFALDAGFTPRPGLTRWERAYLLLDLVCRSGPSERRGRYDHGG